MARATAHAFDRYIAEYQENLAAFGRGGVRHELALRSAFQTLLAETARTRGWLLIPEQRLKRGGRTVVPDAVLRDDYIIRGYWEAKDTDDRLADEITRKIGLGYPITNTIFEDTQTAVLFQNGVEVLRVGLRDRGEVAHLLDTFYAHQEPDIERFEEAVREFGERVPELALGVATKIRDAHQNNKRFQVAFDSFFELCRGAINPSITVDSVDEMLVQHLLTERLTRTIFNNPDFIHQNVIAAEIERVITALVSQSFNREEFLKSLSRFYTAIEDAARGIEDFSEKQKFLNTVYERFFQGYSTKVADTHGIVYTPQAVVDFMSASVAYVLEREFGVGLGDPTVNVLDPCTGTGNFIVNLIRRMQPQHLPDAYREHVFANEIMLLPYYIAALNLEHAYYELTGKYEPFEGLCFVDTLDLAQAAQHRLGYLVEANTARVERQKRAEITVIIANPPYRASQKSANDENKSRKYPVVDGRIRDTFVKDSSATLSSKSYDPYLRFFRWAIDRLGARDGIVCFITNNSFIHKRTHDGVQKHLLREFSTIYHVDLHGDRLQNPKISGTTHNVFGIPNGVGITVAVRRGPRRCEVYYHRVPEDWRRDEKLAWLNQTESVANVEWMKLTPSVDGEWLPATPQPKFERGLVIASTGRSKKLHADRIFLDVSLGTSTNRDALVYDFRRSELVQRVRKAINAVNAHVDRYRRHILQKLDPDAFVFDPVMKWSDDLKSVVRSGRELEFHEDRIREAQYRPFTKKYLYYDDTLVDRPGIFRRSLPTSDVDTPHIVMSNVDFRAPEFAVLATRRIADLHLCESRDGHQVLPLNTYDANTHAERDNISDWALREFRTHYQVPTISKEDVFHYIYALLHHPGYRTTFDAILRKEIPRITLAPDFATFARTGERLLELHAGYERTRPTPLKQVVTKRPLRYGIDDRLRLTPNTDGIIVNETLTLLGIEPVALKYRLGTRSAIEWVIDQYVGESSVERDEDVVRLVGQVLAVSEQTVALIQGLPAAFTS